MVFIMVTKEITGKKSGDMISGLGAGMIGIIMLSFVRAISAEIK
jgi:hypothetical protein